MAVARRQVNVQARPLSDQRSRTSRVINKELFTHALVRARQFSNRSERAVALLIVTLEESSTADATVTWQAIIDELIAAKREMDVLGWFEPNVAIGVIVSDILDLGPAHDLVERARRDLSLRLNGEAARRISWRLYVHPWSEAGRSEGLQQISAVWSETGSGDKRSSRYATVKRLLDVVISSVLLFVLSPLFLLVAALVKCKSPGPVLFKQERLGLAMKPFVMLKFRTMHVNADHSVHRQFVSSFINSDPRHVAEGNVFKIVSDPRITRLGRVLRKTSLDELPQLWNVFRGDMSLVGPRPPLRYEVEQYKRWHRRRIMEAKPGMTGLWQVTGRSRTTFDEMVRLDLRYARTCSLRTDLWILLATPRAVFGGQGAV